MARRRLRALIVALAAAGLATASSAAAAGAPTTVRVRAFVSYTRVGNEYRDLRLTIKREGRAWRSGKLGATYFRPPRPFVRDLDADGEPEVWFDTYSGGAHCCFGSQFFHYRPVARAYGRTVHGWGNVGYRLANVDRRERPELVSSDDRFAYVFTSFAGSFFPVRIWHVDGGRLRDVTREFPDEVDRDARKLWRRYSTSRDARADPRGLLAAWLADQVLLGRERQGWATLEAAFRRGELGPKPELAGWPQGRAYLTELRTFLRKLGYAR